MVASSAADPTILSRDFRSRSSTTMRPPQCLRVCHHRLACLRQIHPCLWQCKRDSIRCNGNSISRNSHQRALRLLQQKIPLQPLSPPTSLIPTVLLQIAVIQGAHGLKVVRKICFSCITKEHNERVASTQQKQKKKQSSLINGKDNDSKESSGGYDNEKIALRSTGKSAKQTYNSLLKHCNWGRRTTRRRTRGTK